MEPLERNITNNPPRPPHSPGLLLAFLTQTVRYHPDLVAHHGSKPTAAAEFFANATERCVKLTPGEPSLEHIQTLLFLGFHRWTALTGSAGWLLIRSAGAHAQCLGYHIDEEREWTAVRDRKKRLRERNQKTDAKIQHNALAQQENFLDCEIQRRTFWSCFLMDRWMSCGKRRPQLFDVHDIETQLPCSDIAFMNGQTVRTRMLGESDEAYARRRQDEDARRSDIDGNSDHHEGVAIDTVQWEVGKDEGELSLYIQGTDCFGKISNWSNKGGRRQVVLHLIHELPINRVQTRKICPTVG
jgi:hypothetical protein